MKILLASPWLGEFGWSICWWIPHIRYLAWRGDYDKVIVGCRKPLAYLYEDFATDIKYVDTEGAPSEYFLDGVIPEWDRGFISELKSKGEVIEVKPSKELKFTNDLFHRILCCSTNDHKYDILLHARNVTRLGTGYRNWDGYKWSHIVNSFANKKIASIGALDGADHIEGTDDLRGMPIDRLIGVINKAKLVVGPSSGAMHLASLCCTPHLVWTAKNKHGTIKADNRCRYEQLWNPFNTRVSILDQDGWKPASEIVIHEIKNMFSNPRIYKQETKKKTRAKKEMAPISMCMTTFNRPEYFMDTIESLKKSNVKLDRLIIFDDNSDDKLKMQFLRRYESKYTVVRNPATYGILMNGRMCIDMCYNLTRGKWFVYCQDDIEFSYDWHYELSEIVGQLYSNGVDWGVLSVCHFHGETRKSYYIKEGGHTGGVCWAINKAMWKMYREDNEFYKERNKRLLDYRVTHWCQHNERHKWAVCHVGRSLVKHIGNESSLTDKDMGVFESRGYNAINRTA